MTRRPAIVAGVTTVTFAVRAGALDVTVPATANIGSGAPGSTITGQLGTVTVSDQRGPLLPAWTACWSARWPSGPSAGPYGSDLDLPGRPGKSCDERVKTLPTVPRAVPRLPYSPRS